MGKWKKSRNRTFWTRNLNSNTYIGFDLCRRELRTSSAANFSICTVRKIHLQISRNVPRKSSPCSSRTGGRPARWRPFLGRAAGGPGRRSGSSSAAARSDSTVRLSASTSARGAVASPGRPAARLGPLKRELLRGDLTSEVRVSSGPFGTAPATFGTL